MAETVARTVPDVDVDESRDVANAGNGFGLMFWFGLCWFIIVVVLAVIGDFLPLKDPNRINPADKYLPVLSEGHLLGTDQLGRDMLARIVDGAQVSMFISFVTVVVGISIGGIIGTVVGYLGGWVETVTMALVNVMLSFPALLVLLGVIAMAGQSLKIIVIVFAILAIPAYIRFARASAITLKEQEWVAASEMMGAKRTRIIFRGLIPNVMITLITFGLLALGGVIVAEGVIAFLGVGVPKPQATWGSMISDGNQAFADDIIHIALVPAAVMFLTILSLNLVGDGLRRRLQVRESMI